MYLLCCGSWPVVQNHPGIFNNKCSAAASFPQYLAPLPRDNILCSFFCKWSLLFHSNTKEMSCFFALRCHFYPLHQFTRIDKIDGSICVRWVYFSQFLHGTVIQTCICFLSDSISLFSHIIFKIIFFTLQLLLLSKWKFIQKAILLVCSS